MSIMEWKFIVVDLSANVYLLPLESFSVTVKRRLQSIFPKLVKRFKK